ncbi:MAG: LamG domain-containing protein, partial [Phycisphaerales bacterium]
YGTDPAALLPVQMMSMETSYDPGALDPDTTYYWRVDEFTPAGTITGPVWSFSTPPVIPITDPNLVGWWKLDDGESLTALDSSGHGNHGTLRNNDGTLMTMTGTEWTTGILDGALFLEDGQYVDFGNDPSLQLTGEVTITAWVKMEPANEGVYMGIAGKLVHSPYNGYELVRHSSNVFRLWMGNDGGDLSSVSSDVTYTDTDWHHVVGVISNNTGYLYVDGVKQVEESAVGLVDTGDFAYIGKHYSNGSDRYWIGTIDDVRLYDYAISAEEIRLMGGDLTLAWSPDPANGAGDVPADTVLAWIPGDGAELQDVYLGTDADAVAAADIYDTTGIYRGRQAETAYIPDDLADGTTYYWRVDQVTVDGSTTCITTGLVWSFTTLIPIPITDPDMLIYYDFEFGEGSMALDQSGHSNHGQFMGTPEWATGLFGGAVSINRDDVDYIEAPPLGIVSNTVSVTGWVKHDESPAAWSGILTHRGTSPGCLGLQHNGSELRYMWGADVYWDVSSGLEMPNGEWYFAALTISPDQGKLYLNGLEQTATNVAPHEPTNFDSVIYVAGDIGNSTGRIMTSLVDEVRFYNRTLTEVEILKLAKPDLVDVTAPGDTVRGVPDDGDWPGHEAPPLAIDDDSGTKYLHFKGASMATGFQVEPSMGPTIVTGLTLTTANDDYGRDPTSFELSGSNESIDGPY